MEKLSFNGVSFLRADALKGVDKSLKRTTADCAAKMFLEKPTRIRAGKFSEAVFDWGKGQRVYSKIDKDSWHKHVHSWLKAVPHLSDKEAIIHGNFKGVGVSFLSKHLRLLYPKRFVTLDSVLEAKLGYARNAAGYILFLRDLNSFKKLNRLKCDIGELESVIYEASKKRVLIDLSHNPHSDFAL